jgi:hypothetical protein
MTRDFPFSVASRSALGPIQPFTHFVQGKLSLGVKRQGREADHSRPARAEAKKMWIYVRFEVFTAVTMKNAVFWNVAPCRYFVKL